MTLSSHKGQNDANKRSPQTCHQKGTRGGEATTTNSLNIDELGVLQRAIQAAEEEDFGPLREWHKQRGDASVVVSHPLHGAANHGTPLYIATVLDSSKAVMMLLSLGADPNWNHPVHGDTCLLHASERAYVDCLRPLLASSRLNGTFHQTVDRKIFLGQGMPQYQEGGLNPLHVAALKGRLEAVPLLLEYDEQRQAQQWLKQTDSFGRGIFQMVVDTLAMKSEKSPVRSSLDSILQLLADRMGLDVRELSIPSASVANAAERERQRALRARCLSTELREKHDKRVRGLLAIESSYVPLHPEVYCSKVPIDALVHQEPVDIGANVKEPLPGVFTFPLLRREFCSRLWEELHNYEAAAISQPEKELPLNVRHDSNLGNLQDCGFANLLGALQAVFRPLVAQYMPHVDGGPFEIYHAFLTRNSPELEKNSTFKLHRDKSDLTFNVCLHKSEDVIGSTVGFYTPEVAGSKDSDPGSAEESRRIFTYEHKVGSVVFHGGSHFHKTDPIQRGTRGSLIVWARLLNHHDPNKRPKVGDVVCLRENARVQSGVLAGAGVGVVLHDDYVSKEPFRVGHIQPERDGREHSYYHVNDLVVLDDYDAGDKT